MATYNTYSPSTVIGRAMFNFDAFGMSNFRVLGSIRVSTSDGFSYADYLSSNYSNFYWALYTPSPYTNEFDWSQERVANLQEILAIYKEFANIGFVWQGDYDLPGSDSTPNPEDVGWFNLSDINISWEYNPSASFAGISSGSKDSILGYVGAAGDIFLNAAAANFAFDLSLDMNTKARQVLMHELGHSLGLSHPHSSYSNGIATITSDYAATVGIGFEQLGFAIHSDTDMYKEYFTIMSYDDQVSLLPGSDVVWQAHTPMILDVIALQQAYGEGTGTSGSGNDTIIAGTAGYRTYFDKGGTDTIDLSYYEEGAYLNMGVTITGAQHLVGVGMSLHDAQTTILDGGNPAHLRWFYGEYENAIGSSSSDLLIGNSMANSIASMSGDDLILGGGGNDTIDGGSGYDALFFSGSLRDFYVTRDMAGTVVRDTVLLRDGTDTITNCEELLFTDYGVNLTIQTVAELLPEKDLDRVIELYVAFFNRVPDADGLEYWIGQRVAGVSVNSIAQSFYNAGVQFSTLTGFSPTMSNSAFVNVVYQNVLGRVDGADAEGLAYWVSKLENGTADRGTLVSTILDSAHSFEGNPTYGWVADLLDNKISVSRTLAIDWGLEYSSAEEAIRMGMAIAAAVTPVSTTIAISLVGVDTDHIDL